jgi:hypothetical protein
MHWKFLLLTLMVFFLQTHVFFNSPELPYREHTKPISPMKTMICRKYFCLTLNQFSQSKNVLDAPDSNTDGFLSRDACVSSTQLNRSFWRNMNTRIYMKYSNQTNSIRIGNNILHAIDSNTDGFLSRDTSVSPTELNKPMWSKKSLSPA